LIPGNYIFMRLVVIASLMLCACTIAPTSKRPGDTVIAYPFASDSVLLHITDLAGDAGKTDTIHFVYYGDESLHSGKELEKLLKQDQARLLRKNYVFVGFAHFGNYRIKRRRDFISPSVKTADGFKAVSNNYGQADRFYSFLATSIIPVAEAKYAGHPVKRSFIGHSLGGLFATYLLVRNDSLFTNLYALSPALWIDDYHILGYEQEKQGELKGAMKTLWISCGSNETLNRIKTGVERLADTLTKREYQGIQFKVKIYEDKSHNSSVVPTLKDILSDL
jgi:predicted alpha/beta superfamily hydrolase